MHSFDYDPSSVACTRQLRDLYGEVGRLWQVERGSVLDSGYMQSLGQFDIVYAWGVLHHTGDLWTSLAYAASRVRQNGFILLAIYNDQGIKTRMWRRIKRIYCSGLIGRVVVVGMVFPYFFLRLLLGSCLSKRNLFANYRTDRGMSLIHDWHDWCGGLPYEVASVEAVFRFFSKRRFLLRNIRTTNGLGKQPISLPVTRVVSRPYSGRNNLNCRWPRVRRSAIVRMDATGSRSEVGLEDPRCDSIADARGSGASSVAAHARLGQVS